jgi:hypothetical protein
VLIVPLLFARWFLWLALPACDAVHGPLSPQRLRKASQQSSLSFGPWFAATDDVGQFVECGRTPRGSHPSSWCGFDDLEGGDAPSRHQDGPRQRQPDNPWPTPALASAKAAPRGSEPVGGLRKPYAGLLGSGPCLDSGEHLLRRGGLDPMGGGCQWRVLLRFAAGTPAPHDDAAATRAVRHHRAGTIFM